MSRQPSQPCGLNHNQCVRHGGVNCNQSVLVCRLVDIEKPSALKSMFGTFQGAVKFDPGSHTAATVSFADQRSLREASQRVGGGIRGMFRVVHSAKGGSDAGATTSSAGLGGEGATGGAAGLARGSLPGAGASNVAAARVTGRVQGGGLWERPGAVSSSGSYGATVRPGGTVSQRANGAGRGGTKTGASVARNPFAFPDAEQQSGVSVNTEPAVGVSSSMLRKRRNDTDARIAARPQSASRSSDSCDTKDDQLASEGWPDDGGAGAPDSHVELDSEQQVGTGERDAPAPATQAQLADVPEDWETWEP